MNKYRIIRHGKEGLFEPQIQTGWVFKTWTGFIDWKRSYFSKYAACFATKVFTTEAEAKEVIDRHKQQIIKKQNGDFDVRVIVEEG